MTWHIYYIRTFTGSLKIFQVMAALLVIVFLSIAHYSTDTNYLTMRPAALLMAMVSFSFFITSLVIFMSVVMGSTDVPYSIFYRVHGVLATVGFVVSGLTYVSQGDRASPSRAGSIAASLSILNSLTFFADTVIAYEPPIDNPNVSESKRKKRSYLDHFADDVYLANEYLDEVLRSLQMDRTLLAAIDPLTIPEFGESSVTITNGRVLGLSAINRNGNSSVHYGLGSVIVSAPIVVPGVLFTGQHKVSKFGISISGDIEAKVDNVQIFIFYRAPRNGGEARLESFQVEELNGLKVTRITGVSKAFNWVLKIVANRVARQFQGKIINTLQTEASKFISSQVDKTRFPPLSGNGSSDQMETFAYGISPQF
ncbi:uncharacterized protein LOC115308469 [Ixodes scapularis]|uniref:uncharacterized protein LOC115308469 n=1 Tax=Ixodes scapularis TaxID=6945 RepID=UPI001C38626D|nr:uncharacterized protein LOC115308469 [Ixodes scapularis]